jgi:AcrR family transcriptional regulator
MSALDHLVSETCDALANGDIRKEELTARQLGARLGKTTSVLYHHWGSLDGFLFAVGQAGIQRLGAAVFGQLQDATALASLAEIYVRFGLDHPVLYYVMFERSYDWDALREAGVFEGEIPGLSLWSSFVAFLAGAGSDDPDGDARILYAGMHGVVSLANSGRANVGDRSVSDRDSALRAVRRLAFKLLPTPQPIVHQVTS